MARPRRSITYEEKVGTEKKRRVVDGEGGASAGPVSEEKEEKGKGWAPGAALPCELGLATGGAAEPPRTARAGAAKLRRAGRLRRRG